MGTLSEITCILNYLIQIRPVWSQISSINSGEVIPSGGYALSQVEAMCSVLKSLVAVALHKQFYQ